MWLPLICLSGLTHPNESITSYQISVSIKYNGVFQPYGAVCSITTPAVISARMKAPTNDKSVTELEESITNNKFSIYPNPSNGNFTIMFAENQAIKTIEVMNMNGQIIKTSNIELHQSQVEFYERITVEGLYFVIAKSEAGVIIDKQKLLITQQ